MEVGAKSGLPLLCLHFALRRGCMKDESLKLHLADAFYFGSDLKRHVPVCFVRVRDLDEPHLRGEIGTDFPSFERAIKPIRPVSQRASNVTVTAGMSRRIGSCQMAI